MTQQKKIRPSSTTPAQTQRASIPAAIRSEQPSAQVEADPKTELARLEGIFHRGQIESIQALRKIRDDKLFMAAGYDDFESYMADRLGKTPSWASHQIHWLRVIELLQAQGRVAPSGLSVDAANTLHKLIDEPELMAAAYLEAAARGEKPTNVRVEAAVKRRSSYVTLRGKVPGLTWDEYTALDALGEERSFLNVADRIDKTKPLVEAVVEIIRAEQKIPENDQLAKAVRGDDLIAACTQIKTLADRWRKLTDLQRRKEKKRAELAAIEKEEAEQEPELAPEEAAEDDEKAPTTAPADEENGSEDDDLDPEALLVSVFDQLEAFNGWLDQGQSFDRANAQEAIAGIRMTLEEIEAKLNS